MKVHAEYTAQLRDRAGCAGDEFELREGATAADLLEAIAARHGAETRALLFGDDGRPSPFILCFVGASQADWGDALPDTAEVTLMTPISGG